MQIYMPDNERFIHAQSSQTVQSSHRHLLGIPKDAERELIVERVDKGTVFLLGLLLLDKNIL